MKNSELTKSIALRCRGKLSEKRIKLRAVAAVLGVSEATIYSKMSGGSDLTLSELSTIASTCNLTREDVCFILFG